MSTKLVIDAPEVVIPAKTLEVREIGMNGQSVGVAFSDGSVMRVELTAQQVTDVYNIILGEVVKADTSLTLRTATVDEPAPVPVEAVVE